MGLQQVQKKSIHVKIFFVIKLRVTISELALMQTWYVIFSIKLKQMIKIN